MTTQPFPTPDGFEWMVSDKDNLNWQIGGPLIEEGRRCRYSETGVRCASRAEVVLWRRSWSSARPRMPWAYCSQHMYGRWIEDGKVLHWKLRPKA